MELGVLDPLFEDVARFVFNEGKAYISHIEKHFKIGYKRAKEIMDQLWRADIMAKVDLHRYGGVDLKIPHDLDILNRKIEDFKYRYFIYDYARENYDGVSGIWPTAGGWSIWMVDFFSHEFAIILQDDCLVCKVMPRFEGEQFKYAEKDIKDCADIFDEVTPTYMQSKFARDDYKGACDCYARTYKKMHDLESKKIRAERQQVIAFAEDLACGRTSNKECEFLSEKAKNNIINLSLGDDSMGGERVFLWAGQADSDVEYSLTIEKKSVEISCARSMFIYVFAKSLELYYNDEVNEEHDLDENFCLLSEEETNEYFHNLSISDELQLKVNEVLPQVSLIAEKTFGFMGEIGFLEYRPEEWFLYYFFAASYLAELFLAHQSFAFVRSGSLGLKYCWSPL